MKFRMNRKGIIIIDDLIALAILGAVLVAIVIIPFFVLKIHIVNVIQLENKYNTADLAMLALLSLKHEGKDMSQTLAEHFVFDNPSDISFVNETLDKIIPSKCYKLTSGLTPTTSAPSYALMIKSYNFGECSPDTTTKTKIPLPYNPQSLTETLELGIS